LPEWKGASIILNHLSRHQSLNLSVIIPVFNEEKRIAQTLKESFAYLKSKRITAEVIVVDDGSTDQTLKVAGRFKKTATARQSLRILKHVENKGKGAAVRTGALAARGKIILYMDADNATPLSEFEEFEFAFKKRWDVVVGSRAVDRKLVLIRQPLHREVIGRIGNFMIQLLVVSGIQDTQCGFKAFSQRAAKVLFPLQTIERFGFDVELLFLARKHRFFILETSVVWRDNPNTRVNAFKDSIRTFTELFIIRWNDWRGIYGPRNHHL
jgi:dolichyl-phosphate beta-glucosyltransferase